jgi:hypothetical protein
MEEPMGTEFQCSTLPSVSNINPDFWLADYSACHLLSCWFFAELISLTLKLEAICSSETSVETQWTTRRHIPEGDALRSLVDFFTNILMEHW